MKLLFLVNDPAFFLSHRLVIGRAAGNAGFEVVVATGDGEGVEDIEAHGLRHRRLPLSRAGRNPLAELRTLFAVRSVIREERPDIVHLVTIKPVLYGGLVSRWLAVAGVVSAISGMGYLFTGDRRGPARRLAEALYRVALGHHNGRVIVQNEADRAGLRRIGALRYGQDVLIPGSGVDLEVFTQTPVPEGPPLAVLPARMLWDKGVSEFVEAARCLRERGVSARFVLVGPHDADNPAAVPLERLERWRDAGPVEWWGRQGDMPAVLSRASLVVLPTFYREGVPKALLEAAAAGRAIVTTDTPGCRDVVEPGVNGELVPIRDSRALADAMGTLLADRGRLEAMGRRSREKAEAEFGVERVVSAHMEIYRSLLDTARE